MNFGDEEPGIPKERILFSEGGINYENFTVSHKFDAIPFNTNRGVLTVGKDQSGKIISVNMVTDSLMDQNETTSNNEIDTPKKAFEDMCKSNSLYSVYVDDLNLITTVPACHLA